MKFQSPLIKARLIQRYKRFMADVTLPDGSEATVHVANPGSMLGGLAEPGLEVWLSDSRNPKRKLPLSWEVAALPDGARVGVNTALPNKVVEEAIEVGLVPDLMGYETLRREVKYGENSRIDILLEDEGKAPAYVEVKSVTLSRSPGLAEFPDAKTTRGAKHLTELRGEKAKGNRAVMLFLVNRTDCDRVTVAADIDPAYAKALEEARAVGVEITALGVDIDEEEVRVARTVEWINR